MARTAKNRKGPRKKPKVQGAASQPLPTLRFAARAAIFASFKCAVSASRGMALKGEIPGVVKASW